MAEVSKNIRQKLIEAGIPVKNERVIYNIASKERRSEVLKKQGVKDYEESMDDGINAGFTDFNNIKDEISDLKTISDVWLEIGKRKISPPLWLYPNEKEYEEADSSFPIAKKYRDKVFGILKEMGFKERK